MFRLAFLFSLAIVLCILPGGYAGPACTRKYYKTTQCVQKCNTRWGYPGSMMGTNPWGVVMRPDDDTDTKTGWDSVIAEACGVSSTKSKSKEVEQEEDDDLEIAGAVGSDPLVEETSVNDDDDAAATTIIGATSSLSSAKPTATAKKTPAVTSAKFVPEKAAAPAPTAKKTTSTPKTSPKPEAPKPAPEEPKEDDPPPSNQGGDIGEYLKGHNDFRKKHGASALTWNDNLASKAKQWANGCKFEHSGGSLGKFGENLAAGTGSAYGIANAIKSWTDEVKDYDPNNPQSSHFTQVVWKNSKQVGCALTLCDGIFEPKFGKAKYVVCEYDPPGNFNSDFARNVQV